MPGWHWCRWPVFFRLLSWLQRSGSPIRVGAGMLGAFVSGQGTEHHRDALANQFRLGIRMCIRGDFLEEFIHGLKTEFLVSHFAAPEAERDFHLHLLAKKVDGMVELDPEIMGINGRAELDFLNFIGVMVLLGFLFLFGLFVTKLAEIDQPADRRDRVGRNFHEVNSLRAGHVDGVPEREDPQLAAVGANHADLASTDFPVDPYE